MKLTTKALVFLLFVSNYAFAQFDFDYIPLKATGTIPEAFVKKAKETSQDEVKNVEYGSDRAAKQQFTIANNYFLRQLFMSGDVLFNDPLTTYVNKVADELLKNNQTVRQQIKIYVTKSTAVNAYAFDKGYIFINLGLLAQLENEAQLAYILSHEITHVLKKHSVNQYIKNIKLDNSAGNYERGNEDKVLARYSFSKEQETEADVEGLILFKQSSYSVKTINRAFDVMQYSYLPFELPEFKKSFFENEYLTIPDTLLLKKVSEIKSNDDYDDSKSTHPNIRKRRASIEMELKVPDEASRKKYIVSEEEFKKSREIARFELCKNYLVERDYVNAVYAAYILLEKYPKNVYLKKIVAQALYNISTNKSYRSSKNKIKFSSGITSRTYTIPDYDKIEGQSQRLYYLFDKMTETEFNVTALSYVFKAHKEFPEDKILSRLTDSLFSQLVNANSLYLGDFSKYSKKELMAMDTVKIVSNDKKEEDEEEESKYTKIKKEKQKVELENVDENFTKYAFVGFLKDDDFVSRYTKAARGYTQKPTEEKKQNTPYKKSKKRYYDEPLLGIDKVIFLDPYYQKVKYEKGNEYTNYYESEEKEATLISIQNKCAEKLKLEYVNFSNKDMTVSDIDLYNESSVMNEWLGERFRHGNNNYEAMTNYEEMKKISDKYGTPYIAWSGVYNSKGRRYSNTYFFIVFNIESGELLKFETRYTRSKDNRDLITSFVYNSLMYVKKKEKE
jgi:predicted Zn-dependent protease